MRKFFLLSIMAGSIISNAQLKYPGTRKINVSDDYHGTTVIDPYRWLEDDNSAETKEWVKQQNKVTSDYLSSIPFRSQVRQRLKDLWDYPKYSSPFQKAGVYYFFKNEGLQNQAVMYRQVGLNGKPEEFLNPNTLNKDGIAALGGWSFSKSGKYFAYSISMAGSDWQEVFVMETATKKLLSDKVQWVKFSGITWKGDDGFYYSGYDKPDEKTKLSGQNQFHKAFYHKLGTEQPADQLVYEDKTHPLRSHSLALTEDERFLILYITEGTSGIEIWSRDMKDASQKTFKQLIKGFKTEAAVVDNQGGKLLVYSNDGAPNYKLVLVDPKNPSPATWQTIIPEKSEVLQSVNTGGGYLFAQYLRNASTRVSQLAYDGTPLHEIELPGIGTADGFGAEKQDKELFYTYTSFKTPPVIYRYDIKEGKSTIFRNTKTNLKTDDFVTEQIFVTSRDGARVPVFLTYREGINLDGSNPLLLYGYGGFNIPLTPAFSMSNAFFIEQGGIYAVVNLRGGSEYGEQWHKAGMLDKKQNVFNDFIAVAQFLIKNRYTSSAKIAMRGGSNGGLLVGAVMTQRPELFRVALPAVGVLDMLRYHKFTIGYAWAVEYGSADSIQQFPYLYKYSPYHNLKQGVRYPATLVTTADHDDRVVPAHSFKFAARLQEYGAGGSQTPYMIRIDTDAGHGAGKPTNKMIDEAADTWSFVMQNLGMTYESNPAAVVEKREKDGKGGKGTGFGGAKGDGKGDAKAGKTTTGETTDSKTDPAKPTTVPETKPTQQQKSKSPLRKRNN